MFASIHEIGTIVRGFPSAADSIATHHVFGVSVSPPDIVITGGSGSIGYCRSP